MELKYHIQPTASSKATLTPEDASRPRDTDPYVDLTAMPDTRTTPNVVPCYEKLYKNVSKSYLANGGSSPSVRQPGGEGSS
jgi:hypothetical protein